MGAAKVWGMVGLVCAIGCGGGDDPGGTGPNPNPNPNPGGGGSTSNAIDVRDNSFSPSATTVVPATTVTWTWRGSATHNVVFDDGPSSELQSSGSYSRAFPAAGTFPYHCTVHGSAMSGQVVVR